MIGNSPLVPLSILRAAIIIAVVIIVSLTLLAILDKVFGSFRPSNCVIAVPFGATLNDEHCSFTISYPKLKSSSIYSTLGQTSTNNNSNMSTTDRRTAIFNAINDTGPHQKISKNYLNGYWSLAGSVGSIDVFAKMNITAASSSYSLDGNVGDQGKPLQYSNVGMFILAQDRMLLYFINNNGTQSIYTMENMKNDSFQALNPNSRENYNFHRILDQKQDNKGSILAR